MKSTAKRLAIDKAYHRCTWKDLVNLSPEQAASVMTVVLGTRVLAIDAVKALGKARNEARLDDVEATVASFKKSQFETANPTDTYRMMCNKKLGARWEPVAETA